MLGGEGVVRPGFGKGGAQLGVWRRSPQLPTNFCDFQITKTFILAHFFIEKGHAVTTDQGWASFSHEGPDLKKLLKSRAAS